MAELEVTLARALGWHSDPAHAPAPVSFTLEHLAEPTPTVLPDVISTRRFIVAWLNQEFLGRCTGTSWVQAIRMVDIAELCGGSFDLAKIAAAVAQTEYGSDLAAYFFARVLDGSVGWDAGSSHGSVAAGMAQWGLPPERLWTGRGPDGADTGSPQDKFRRMPDSTALRAAFDARMVESFAIDDPDPNVRVQLARAALNQNQGVVIGGPVSKEFVDGAIDPTKPLEVPTAEDTAGGHAQFVWGARVVDGEVVFDVGNNWTADWGNGGSSVYSSRFAQACDLRVIRRAAQLPAGAQ